MNIGTINSIKVIFTITVLTFTSCSKEKKEMLSDPKKVLLEELEHSFNKELIDIWYPRVLDTTHGGFLSDFDHRWEPKGNHDKMIVTQARHVWTCAKVAAFSAEKAVLKSHASHGFKFLKESMWDPEHGGFYNLLDRQGNVKPDGQGNIIKNAYGNAFAIYGLAAYYGLSGEQEALELAKQTFHWLEEHSYDSLHGGYFQFMQRDGTPLVSGYGNAPPKDQNSTIHLLEAFTELYHAWPDDTLRERLSGLLVLIRDTITTDKGYMNLFFNRDWTPVSYRDSTAEIRAANYQFDHVSFGHDVETAFLLLEASEALEIENNAETLQKAKAMVDHALQNGWDTASGGLYDQGYYFKEEEKITIIKDTKVWWSQAETLNTLLMMADLFPDDEARYFEKFKILWDYTKTYLIDHEHGGWYWGGLDKEPEWKTGPKAQIWKVNYHTARSMMHCIERLKINDQ
ncbi:AGE family epimerase/isomerase [Fulvivirgaceae bacterium BMA12]|uniref:AGE family epimerase/isomerase n=1 Tax=Agaribacillus aureus TaxID=3051825 RepID=A0ABT8L3K7_9BACT|nr:AGE family epimerase/isomerase [Fulvivirgaceae bacterium BMA12]